MKSSERYFKILNVLYNYYEMSEENAMELLKDNDAKYLLVLLLYRYKCIDEEKLKHILNLKSRNSIINYIRKAEKRLLISRDFREIYFELEEGLLKQG